jgi:hypothetical protein
MYVYVQGKRLFMPLRLLLTGKIVGPEMESAINLLRKAENSGIIGAGAGLVTLDTRMQLLKEVMWDDIICEKSPTAEGETVLSH